MIKIIEVNNWNCRFIAKALLPSARLTPMISPVLATSPCPGGNPLRNHCGNLSDACVKDEVRDPMLPPIDQTPHLQVARLLSMLPFLPTVDRLLPQRFDPLNDRSRPESLMMVWVVWYVVC